MKRTFYTGRQIAFLLGPLSFILLKLLVPDNFISPGADSVFALSGWMIVWWVTEAVPIPVTALLPLVFLPLLGIMKMKEAAAVYAHPIIFLFMGGFMIALALEKHRLHERIALNLIRITGTSGNGIILGFMVATAFLSMWISNTATAMMMLPIAISVVHLLHTKKMLKPHELPLQEKNFALGLLLMVGYAATLGGLATIIGTPPNVVFAGLVDEFYHIQLDFGKWMLIGVPLSVTLLGCTYFIITRVLFPNNIQEVEGADNLIREKLDELGEITKEEKRVLAVFSLTSFMWIFQNPLNAYIFKSEVFNDPNIAMAGGLLMFLVPADFKNFTFLLSWKDTFNLQWGILILFGGGLCLASGLEKTNIIQTTGTWLASMGNYNVWVIAGMILITVSLSEFLSNVALVQIFVPVIFGIADNLHINPIFLAMPITLSASIGFMFPIATPPNAIVFSSGYIRMRDMVRAGILLDIASMIIILLASVSLVKWVYG